LDIIENDMSVVGVCVGDIKNQASGGLGPRWPTPNSLEEYEGEKEVVL